MKKILSIFLITLLIMSSFSSFVYAKDMGDDIEVTDVRFVREHSGYSLVSSYIEFRGSNLSGQTFRFEKSGLGGGFEEMGDKTVDEDGFVKFVFTLEEANYFGGKILLNGVEIDLDLGQFPNITGAADNTINVDNNEDLVFYGNYLDNIDGTNITAEFGRTLTKSFAEPDGDVSVNDDGDMTLTAPTPPGDKGFQNVQIKKEVEDVGENITTSVENFYSNAFRFVSDVGVTNLRIYPNTGAKGSEAYLTGEGFVNTKDYQVYFLKAVDGSDEFSDVNKAEIVNLDITDENTGEGRLTFNVPDHENFGLRTYYIMLTDNKSGEIIGQQLVKEDDDVTNDLYTVIGAGFAPTIEQIFPDEGSDTGSNVQISGRNILTLSIPDLETDNIVESADATSNDEVLNLEYQNKDYSGTSADGLYDGEPVEITRTVSIQIGKKTSFVRDESDDVVYSQGTPDSVLIKTQNIDDAIDDPLRDVIIEIDTTLEEVNGSNTYTFNQIVSKTNGYEFIPSTLTPVIKSVHPAYLQADDSAVLNKFAKDIQLSVKGSEYLVERIVDENGEVITKYPSVLIKKDDTNTFIDSYQLGFFPNETITYDPGSGEETYRGLIKYRDGTTEYILTDGVNNIELDDDGDPVSVANVGEPFSVDMTVVDDNNAIVDGTTNNEVGSKILVMIPNEALIEDLGIKHVQVTNLRRGSDQYGNATLVSDVVDVVKTTEIPVIENVNPNIMTITGEKEVVVTGNNFQEGVIVYLDGELMEDVDREIDTQGNQILLTFEAPSGREGTTQLQIVNPSGGMDTADFIYVKTFNKDPELESLTPDKGTAETLVVAAGNNYLSPDPTVVSTQGLDAYRLIGTRVILDGNDVNEYNYAGSEIKFEDYTSPENNILILEEAGEAVFSPFYENVLVKRQSDGKIVHLTNDGEDYPLLTDNEGIYYTIRYNSSDSKFYAYNESGAEVGEATIEYDGTSDTTITIDGGDDFIATMDNKILLTTENEDGDYLAKLANYADSVILKNPDGTYYIIKENLDGELVITNGKDKTYSVTYDNTDDRFEAQLPGESPVPLRIEMDSIVFEFGSGDEALTYITPYIFDEETGEITGDRTNVLNKQQLTFSVPKLQTGKGYKNVTIENPDTKQVSFTGQNGFYYIDQPASNPIISAIEPDKGSVDGSYTITIYGSDFEETSKVYIDGVLVAAEDTEVNIDGTQLDVIVPPCTKNLNEDYGVDQLRVPVVIANQDGGTAYREKGFMYIIPVSSPEIEEAFVLQGSANGGEIVEIIGYEFRFFEPYRNRVGGPEYNPGDELTDLYNNDEWDDLLALDSLPDLENPDGGVIQAVAFSQNPFYEYYYESPLLPDIYFGQTKGKIVEFSQGYIKVITPAHEAGTYNMYLVNNDYGVSNKLNYQFVQSDPKIDSIVPNVGRRQGQEHKDIYGSKLESGTFKGYKDDDAATIQTLDFMEASVRFGNVDNTALDITEPNSGRINGGYATIQLDGGLQVIYQPEQADDDEDSSDNLNTIEVKVIEDNNQFTRKFTNYDNSEVFIPMEMLINPNDNKYYRPFDYDVQDGTSYSNTRYEMIKVYVEDRRVFVERGYAPTVNYDNKNHVTVRTPSYHTVDPVNVTYVNGDGGTATIGFTYTNPASEPKILQVNPREKSFDKTHWLVNGTIQGKKSIEIIGEDFRDGVNVTINGKQAAVGDLGRKKMSDGNTYDFIIAQIPQGSQADIGQKYPIIVTNDDAGLANSALEENLLTPLEDNNDDGNLSEADKLLYYFSYKKPLSGPEITEMVPSETSVFGGNEIKIVGKDFRSGAYVILGSAGGVPIDPVDEIDEEGYYIKFTSPENLTLGEKDVQVINEDYGIDILENGIKMISYPTVEEDILTEDGSQVKTRVSVEGGDKIRLKGSGFQEGAKVYFGGNWTEKINEDQEGPTGLFKDDRRIILENAVEAQAVEWVDSETLLVTTPALTKEQDYELTVINKDGGISDNNAKITYRVPIPSDPVNLDAEVVDDRYIKIFNYTSEAVDYFEIYAYIGAKSEKLLKKNKYLDFQYIDNTEKEPYKITRLPGVENMRKDEDVYIVLKAVNKFGPSEWSNIVKLDYDEFEDVEVIGPPDLDDDLGVPEGQNYEFVETQSKAKINITDKEMDSTVEIDLSRENLEGVTEKIINVPEDKVKSSTALIYINFGDSVLQFSPINLNTSEFRELAFYETAYGQIKQEMIDNDYSAMLKGYIPRGTKPISDVQYIGFNALTNEEEAIIDRINGAINIGFSYDEAYILNDQSVGLYRFNGSQWGVVEFTQQGTTLTTEVSSPGYYIILKK